MSIIVGAILALIGLIMTICGGVEHSSDLYKYYKLIGRTSETRGTDAILAIGIIFLIVGIVLIALTFLKKANGGNSVFKPANGGNVNIGTPAQSKCRCAKCGAVMNGAMQFCPECGSQDKIFTQTPSAPTAQAPATFCGNCGAPMAPGETFCHVCGKRS